MGLGPRRPPALRRAHCTGQAVRHLSVHPPRRGLSVLQSPLPRAHSTPGSAGRRQPPALVLAMGRYVGGPVVVSLDWIHDGVTWIAGQRPTQQATVVMDEYEFQPPEIHVARGTLVTWRNVDEEGEAHTVTADGGQSA